MRTPQPRPEYDVLVTRILSGELTRLQAADLSEAQTGLRPQTFLSWLRTSGKLPDLKATRRNAGSLSPFAHKDPNKVNAYADALALALSGRVSVRQAAIKHGVSYIHLLRKWHRAKEDAAGEATVRELTKALDVA